MAIPVLNSFRDLGSHLNLTKSPNASTLAQRLKKATIAVGRLAFVPITQSAKETVIRCTILPAALYGCESAHIPQWAFAAFRGAIADAVGAGSAKRSVDANFAYTHSATPTLAYFTIV